MYIVTKTMKSLYVPTNNLNITHYCKLIQFLNFNFNGFYICEFFTLFHENKSEVEKLSDRNKLRCLLGMEFNGVRTI